jgi:hypothetical protein
MAFTKPSNTRNIWRQKGDVITNKSSEIKADWDSLVNLSADDVIALITQLEHQSASGNLGALPNGWTSATTINGQILALKTLIDAVYSYVWGTSSIENLAITEPKLADSSVTVNKIGTGAVTEPKVATNAITTVKVVDSAITEPKIADDAVTTNKVKNSNITTDKVATNAITTNKIADSNVTTDKLATSAVTELKLATGAVTETKVGTGAITTNKLGDSAVTTDKIEDYAVTTDKIEDSAVTTDKIASFSILSDGLATSAVTESKIAIGAVTNAKIDLGAVDANRLAASSVVESKLATGSVTATKLADGAITNAKVADATLTKEKLTQATIDFLKFFNLQVGQTTTGAAGTNASVVNTGTTSEPVLQFTIPQGLQGIEGPQGDSYDNSMTEYGGTLETNKKYYKTISTNTTFTLPTATADIDNTILLCAKITGTPAVNLGTTNLYENTVSSLTAGNYDFVWQYDFAESKWFCGVIKKVVI